MRLINANEAENRIVAKYKDQQDGCNDWVNGYNEGLNEAQDIILELYDHSTEGEWIPCSERLPNKEGSYLITSETGAVTTAHWYMPSEWRPDGFWGRVGKKKTVAWMPLPTPYKGGDDE